MTNSYNCKINALAILWLGSFIHFFSLFRVESEEVTITILRTHVGMFVRRIACMVQKQNHVGLAGGVDRGFRSMENV